MLTPLKAPGLSGLRINEMVSRGFRSIVSGDEAGEPDWARDLANGTDEGYFGPQSAPWAVHGALPTIVGGVRALLVQALHPGALAGVRQQSRYAADPLGRLAGTTRWLTVTTFGDRASADRDSARVRGMHRKVVGTYDDGRVPYSAMDPHLLRWVHIAFTDSFLATHERWGGPIPGGPDAYVREWAKAGELVGVTDPPRSVAELRQQMADYLPELRYDADTADTVEFIRHAPLPKKARPAYAVLYAGAVSTLTPEYRELLHLRELPPKTTYVAVKGLLAGLGLALGQESPSMRNARQRIDALDGRSVPTS